MNGILSSRFPTTESISHIVRVQTDADTRNMTYLSGVKYGDIRIMNTISPFPNASANLSLLIRKYKARADSSVRHRTRFAAIFLRQAWMPLSIIEARSIVIPKQAKGIIPTVLLRQSDMTIAATAGMMHSPHMGQSLTVSTKCLS